MVHVGDKDVVARSAVARGALRLRASTVRAVREGRVAKGDVVATATVAGIQAVKRTPETLPLCHPIPITGVDVSVEIRSPGVVVTCEVAAEWKTGVEMEALCGVTAALLAVWDMVKPLEKDAKGQYPNTRLEDVRVVEKRKGKRAGRWPT